MSSLIKFIVGFLQNIKGAFLSADSQRKEFLWIKVSFPWYFIVCAVQSCKNGDQHSKCQLLVLTFHKGKKFRG